MLSLLISPFNKLIAIIGLVFTVLLAVYGKGRGDATSKHKLKSLEDTQDAITRANNARNTSTTESDRGGLLDDDGFQRK